ncbi:MAG: sulfotransferase [Magnetococcales bacterium]|nr:sulfotransferase [Magnetococcales bacterium]MBF0115552.1 sulfotransferase [Magnetococcales bacterium]
MNPLIIGATGGSGTRAVRSALMAVGAYMGTNVNESGDLLDFDDFLENVINRILQYTRSLDYSINALPAGLRMDLMRSIQLYEKKILSKVPDGVTVWGWKNPRSMYLLPLLNAALPNMHFLHVVRDGRDMALSHNQNQLQKHYIHYFNRPIGHDRLMASMQMWSVLNLEVAACGARQLGHRYHRVRLEDLVNNGQWLREFFPELSAEQVQEAGSVIQTLKSHGRWSALPESRLLPLQDKGKEGLAYFGYL